MALNESMAYKQIQYGCYAIVIHCRYLQNKQRKHYSQQVEDGTTTAAGNAASLSRITFGVLW